MKKTKIIGLTGPIASGKNEVAKILRRRGACVIDADEIGHELLTPQSDIWKSLLKEFGSKILLPEGKVSRKKLGRLAFSDPKMLKKLNKIMHPVMRERIKSKIQMTNDKQCKIIVVNAAVLKEMGLIPLVDEVWVVLADKKKRLNRLVKKGYEKNHAAAMIKSQMADGEYSKIADTVIRNNGTKVSLKRQVLDSFML